jgi:hypothetical protein
MFLNFDLAYNIIIITFIHFIGRVVAMAMSYCPVILKILGAFDTTVLNAKEFFKMVCREKNNVRRGKIY